MIRFIVGTRPHSINSVVGSSNPDPLFTTLCLPTFYKDTRGESGHGGCSNIFTSSNNPNYATMFDTFKEAEDWNKEFLDGEGIIYRVN